MYTWTIRTTEFDYDKFLNDTMRKKCVESADVQKLRALFSKCSMRFNLRNLIFKVLQIVEDDSHNQIALSSLVEIVAGCQYAHNDPTVGRLRQIKKHFSCRTNMMAIELLRRFCTKQLASKAYNDKDLWFKLRISCMDSYALCHILSCKHPLCIYYAGMAHTRNIEQYLLDNSLAIRREITDPMHASLKTTSDKFGMLHFSVLSLDACDGPHALILMGEDHSMTDVQMSDHLLQFLRDRCSQDSQTLFLIEKHISNNTDPLQSKLACNQPHLAIHKSRCDAFVESDHESCPSLTIVPVDNRHTDMGFFRLEIMDLWNYDDEFKKIASEFQDASLRSMLGFCNTVMACNQFKAW